MSKILKYISRKVRKVHKKKQKDPPGSSDYNPSDFDSEDTNKVFKAAWSSPSKINQKSHNSYDLDSEDTNKPLKTTSPSASETGRESDNRIDSNFSTKIERIDTHKNGFHDSKRLEDKKELYRDNVHDSKGLQSVQELESYAVERAEETTDSVNNCLKIAENIREDATQSLTKLHQQTQKITETHMVVAKTEKDLSKGEKLSRDLGGLFSKRWKPKHTKGISGPKIVADNSSETNQYNKEQRKKLGLAPIPEGRSAPRTPPPEPTNALEKVEVEKVKQDEALSQISDILDDLKNVAVDMRSELDRQNEAIDHLGDDANEFNYRLQDANQRMCKLIKK